LADEDDGISSITNGVGLRRWVHSRAGHITRVRVGCRNEFRNSTTPGALENSVESMLTIQKVVLAGPWGFNCLAEKLPGVPPHPIHASLPNRLTVSRDNIRYAGMGPLEVQQGPG